MNKNEILTQNVNINSHLVIEPPRRVDDGDSRAVVLL